MAAVSERVAAVRQARFRNQAGASAPRMPRFPCPPPASCLSGIRGRPKSGVEMSRVSLRLFNAHHKIRVLQSVGTRIGRCQIRHTQPGGCS